MKNMRKLLVLSLVSLMFVGCNNQGSSSEAHSSSESQVQQSSSEQVSSSVIEDDPNIDSEEELKALVNKGETITKDYQLTKDIYYSSFAGEDYYATTFNGKFNGNGHTIYLLAENLSDTGIFYKIGEQGEVKNLNIRLVLTAGDSIPSVGGVANYNEGLITNVNVYGENYKEESITYQDGISSTGGEVGSYMILDEAGGAGGIVGTNNGTIKYCKNYARVSAVTGGGGIAGVNNGLIEECYNLGAIGTTGTASSNVDKIYDYSTLGGIAGVNKGTITKCMNRNQVFAARYYKLYPKTEEQKENSEYSTGTNYRNRIGGIAGINIGTKDGDNYTKGIITESLNFGRVHGDMRVGGIAGESSGYIANCFASGFVGARESLGGIVGYQKDDNPGKVTHCVTVNRIKSNDRAITLEDGTQVTAPELTANKGKDTISNVVNYYKVAKYADNCLMHNNCGEIDPIGENNAASTGNYKKDVADVTFYNEEHWSEFEEDCAVMNGLNSSYQVALHNHLLWQEVDVKVVDLAGNEKTVTLLKGVNYTNILTDSSGKYTGSFTGIANGCSLGVIPSHELANLGITPNDGMVLKFVSDKNNPDSVVDIITDDTMLYAIQVAQAE
ncbi:MAG: hypothetical protein E7177_00610 [Erysipelotrichaceae bacterium]|nr:hypothetical protein [Erysipelotrichaceae bacterium]